MNSIKLDVQGFYKEMQQTPHHRYRSWEHCYQFFSTNPTDTDKACLHLAFYLASWGMYRGSTFLLQKDYLIHHPIVEEIMKPKYSAIRAITLQSLNEDSTHELSGMILELVQWIKSFYTQYIDQDPNGPINVTDTLATKILLGTIGCIPAYDRYFICGLRHLGLPYSVLNSKNFSKFLKYCINHEAEFTEAQKEISAAQKGKSEEGINYPVMKVIDMHLWITGKNAHPIIKP